MKCTWSVFRAVIVVSVVLVGTTLACGSAVPPVVAASPTGVVASADQHFSGSGNRVVELPLAKGLVVFDASVTDSERNFIVWLQRTDGSNVALLANSIGDSNGTVAARAPVAGTYRIDIQSDGNWQIEARQPRATTAPSTRFWSGNGESVTDLFYLKVGTYKFTGSHQGESNFIVHRIDLDGQTVDFLANEIGTADVERVFLVEKAGVFVLSVDADGPWTLTIEHHYIPYKFSNLSVPSTARRYTWFNVSVRLNPAYVGLSSTPVTMYAQKKSGSRWTKTLKSRLYGVKIGSYTKYGARLSVQSGTWRVWAVFKDAEHATKKTGYKYVKVR